MVQADEFEHEGVLPVHAPLVEQRLHQLGVLKQLLRRFDLLGVGGVSSDGGGGGGVETFVMCGSEDGHLRVYDLQSSSVNEFLNDDVSAPVESVLLPLDFTVAGERVGSGVGVLAVAGMLDESSISMFRVVDVRPRTGPE